MVRRKKGICRANEMDRGGDNSFRQFISNLVVWYALMALIEDDGASPIIQPLVNRLSVM